MKESLRQTYKAERNKISAEDRELYSRLIANFFLSSKYAVHQTFHIFLPISKFNEINTYLIIKELWKRKKTVVVPKMERKSLLNCKFTEDTELEANDWGIQEPVKNDLIASEEIDVVLVPMLICDQKGNRVGYGGGFYDRFLPTLKKEAKLVGVNYFETIEKIETEPHDIPLDAIITPKGVFVF